jgi:hypothetical protein
MSKSEKDLLARCLGVAWAHGIIPPDGLLRRCGPERMESVALAAGVDTHLPAGRLLVDVLRGIAEGEDAYEPVGFGMDDL